MVLSEEPNMAGNKIADRLAQQLCSWFFRMFLMCSVDLLHHHDGIINNKAYGSSNSTKCHNVERITNYIQNDEG